MSEPDPVDAFARVTAIFHRVIDLAPDARRAAVEAEADGDGFVVAEVMALLAAHDRADGFIDPDAAPHTSTHRPSIPPAGREATGAQLGHYRVVRTLGEGGMGLVYLAQDTRLDRLVALKVLAPHLAPTGDRQARLAREARAAAALNHPNIATVYALEEIEGRWCIASEYVPGPTLRDAMAEGDRGVAAARAALRVLAAAVGAAHARGIVHRDLKPENIVRAPDGTLKILDFGLARFLEGDGHDTSVTREGDLFGTPGYMAPEQIRGEHVDQRADIFALGVIAYEQATGRHPFQAGHPAATLARVLADTPARFAGEDDATARAFEAVAFACLDKEPAGRPRDADAIVRALDALPTLSAPPRPTPPSRWWWRFHQAAAIAAHVLLLLPIWGARDLSHADRGMWLFLCAVLAVSVGGALRMHLLFAARHYPAQFRLEHRRWVGWIRGSDVLFAATLAIAGVQAIRAEAPAVLLVAAAASVTVASCVIEPTTTRAAWGEEGGKDLRS